MNGALNAWRLAVARQLEDSGINAAAAMDSARAARWRRAVVAVSLGRVACGSGGFQDYLGVQKDPDGGNEREVYGKQAELTLALDVFAPRDGGESMCQEAAEKTAECLIGQGAAGLPALEVQAGRVEFLERDGLYHQELACRCTAWLVARTDEGGGVFTDFEVKGRMK